MLGGKIKVHDVGEAPVVTVWPMIGPLLRTRRNWPVFTFWNVTVLLPPGNHCWLAKPSPPFPAGVNVTFALGDLLVRASPRLLKTTVSVGEKQRVHWVVLFSFGFRNAAAPEKVELGVPRK
jgi:hypothetical protein